MSEENRYPQYNEEFLRKLEEEAAEARKLAESQEIMFNPPANIDKDEWSSSVKMVQMFYGGDKYFVMHTIETARSIIHKIEYDSLPKVLGRKGVNLYAASNDFASAVSMLVMAKNIDIGVKLKKLYDKNHITI